MPECVGVSVADNVSVEVMLSLSEADCDGEGEPVTVDVGDQVDEDSTHDTPSQT